MEDVRITRFREYLKIRTDHPYPQYNLAVEFLKLQAEQIGLNFKVIELVPNKPILLMSWIGTNPELSSILLNSHMDVVPATNDDWNYKPFEAVKDCAGNIYARGAQDMKCVSMWYLEAIRILKKRKISLKRTIYLSFVPDEEISGADGMKKFVHCKEFQSLNLGFVLDEGIASEDAKYYVFYGERLVRTINITIKGKPGHGSNFIGNSCSEKLLNVLTAIYNFRENEQNKLKMNSSLTLGDVTTVNLTMINGGVQHNVLPSTIFVCVDIRMSPLINNSDLEAIIDGWCQSLDSSIEWKYMFETSEKALTKCEKDYVWYDAFMYACEKMSLEVSWQIFQGATDSRFIREGIPVYGFSPINHTSQLLHDCNEYLNESIYLRGIDIYVGLLEVLASV